MQNKTAYTAIEEMGKINMKNLRHGKTLSHKCGYV